MPRWIPTWGSSSVEVLGWWASTSTDSKMSSSRTELRVSRMSQWSLEWNGDSQLSQRGSPGFEGKASFAWYLAMRRRSSKEANWRLLASRFFRWAIKSLSQLSNWATTLLIVVLKDVAWSLLVERDLLFIQKETGRRDAIAIIPPCYVCKREMQRNEMMRNGEITWKTKRDID